MSWAQGTSSHTMVQRSELTVCNMVCGSTPRKSTAREPDMRLPIQCIFAPVW